MSAEEAQVKLFASKCKAITDGAFVGLAACIGVQHGLWDVLAQKTSADAPLNSQEIADAAGCRERYVREWLNSMVCAELVQVSADGQKYWVCDAGRKVLADKLTWMWIPALPMLAKVEDAISAAFKPDGPPGTRYSQYDQFHAWMTTITGGHRAKDFFMSTILPKAPEVQQLLTNGARSVDIGCGRGMHSFWLAQAFEKSEFIGVDFCEDPIAWANENNRAPNVKYFAYDAKALPADWTESFDFVTMFDALHDQGRPDLALDEIVRILKPGGYCLILDINMHTNVAENLKDPKAMICYVISMMHCMPVSLNEENGMGLGACWGRERAVSLLAEHGLHEPKFVYEDDSNMALLARKDNA